MEPRPPPPRPPAIAPVKTAGGTYLNPEEWSEGKGKSDPGREGLLKGMGDMWKWKVGGYKDKPPIPPSDVLAAAFPVLDPVAGGRWEAPPADGSVQATWIGHSTFLVQMAGLNILTDPVFSCRCGPVQFPPSPARFTRAPADIEALPKIDCCVISHNHFDHLDSNSVAALLPKVRHWYVPEGLRSWFLDAGCEPERVTELSWWGEATLEPEPEPEPEAGGGAGETKAQGKPALHVQSAPCMHWSQRSATDANKSLWCAWALWVEPLWVKPASPTDPPAHSRSVYFAGDSAYDAGGTEREGALFKATGAYFRERFGLADGEDGRAFELGLIPIGAYEPFWFMCSQHCNPEEAVSIHIDVGCRRSIGMHWGTFALADEEVREPPERLAARCEELGLPEGEFRVIKHGEVVTLD